MDNANALFEAEETFRLSLEKQSYNQSIDFDKRGIRYG